MRILAALIVALLALGAYIRLAPVDPARWHMRPDPRAPGTYVGEGWAELHRPGDLARLDAIARATPRTRIVAGGVAEGMVTYETRSRLWGFPDYTTVWDDDGTLRMRARLRFGRRDLGVNRARLEDWSARLDAP